MSCKRKEPRIRPAVNGLILEWEEYEEEEKYTYEGYRYLGTKQQIFTEAKALQCINEFIKIAKECEAMKS